jgi:penicillin-binding protein 1A
MAEHQGPGNPNKGVPPKKKITLDKNKAKPVGNGRRKSVRMLWRAFWLGVIAFNLIIILINSGLLGYMPSMKELENPSSALSSEVYASDGTILGRYYVKDRSTSKYEEISPNVLNALLATEDARFYEHSGIDGRAVMRAVFKLGSDGGGSTISQQLAKNLFPRRNPNLFTLPFLKLKEWVLAVKLERNLTKNEVITLYLNTVPFGDNVYGIKNASLTFFNKLPGKVTIDEAAVLIGMLKGNTLYNPRRNPERAKDRRNTVLGQMVRYGFISAADMDKVKDKAIKLDYHKLDYHEGMAPYFRQEVEKELKKILKGVKKPNSGEDYNIYKDGLRVYTTIDPRMQRYAEQAVEQHIKEIQKLFVSQASYKNGSVWEKGEIKKQLQLAIKQTDRYKALKEEKMSEADIMKELSKPIKMKVFAWTKSREKDTVMSPIDSVKYMKMFLQAGFMVMDPYTGDVKAWVGGIDHNYFQFDHVNIDTKRQVGSTIKPLLYCLAIDNGFSPCGSLPTTAQSFPGYMKGSYDAGGSKYGALPMSKALALSVNNAALYLINQVGINAFVDFAQKAGISSKMDKVPSAALGVSDISLFEMLWAYTMFPTMGVNTKPVFISKIEDKNGNLIKSFVPQQKELISAQTAYKMIKMMKGVVDFGTGRRMRGRYGITSEIAGKTGTTNSQADGWFIGYTPQLLAGAWVGCDDRYLRFGSEALGQGSAAALPIWAYFIKRVYSDKSLGIEEGAKFTPPDDFQDCGFYDTNSLDRASGTYGGPAAQDSSGDPIDEAPPLPNEEYN